MTENELKDIMDSAAGMALWRSYCDVKMELEDANDRIFALESLLRRWYETGCPHCGGDCGSANPPVNACLVADTNKALRKKKS